MRIDHEDEPVAASHALLKVGIAALLALGAGFVLLRLQPSSETPPQARAQASADREPQFPPLPPMGSAPEGLALTREDVAFLSELTAKLNRDPMGGPDDDEINRVQALFVPRPENAKLRTFLVELCYRRAGVDLARGASDQADSMLARIRSLDGDSPRLSALELEARTRRGGVLTGRSLGVPGMAAPAPDSGTAPERERAAPRIDADKSQIQSSSFDVRFDGESQSGIARDVLFVLDRAYTRLSDIYYDKPNRKIPVILHSQQDYYTKTGSPFWSGGVYNSHDGAIQIPVKGMPSTLPGEMENVLVHELSHAFVDEMSGGFASRDLQEGLAQYMEGKRIEEELTLDELKRLARTGRQSVMSFYMLSLAVSQQLVQSRGQTAVNQLLKAMRETGSEDGGFQKTFGRSGAAMRRDILETFWRRYS